GPGHEEGARQMNEHEDDLLLEPERYELLSEVPVPLDLGRRDFFRVVGAGIVVACLLDESPAQRPKGKGGRFGGGQPRELGAWLHVAADSKVTVFTGKVEVGQNIRTSLTQVVAEELR